MAQKISGGKAELAWLRQVGLDASAKPDSWKVNLVIQTAETPITTGIPVYSSDRDTRFELWVDHTGWKLYVCHGGKQRSYWPDQGWVNGTLTLPVPDLADLRGFLDTFDKKLKTKLTRDQPYIRTNIKGGKQAIAKWLTR